MSECGKELATVHEGGSISAKGISRTGLAGLIGKRRRGVAVVYLIGALLASLGAHMAFAQQAYTFPKVDRRAVELRHLNKPYIFAGYKTREEWLKRAEYLRRHILVCAGLWPQPDKTPLNARIFGRTEKEDYTLEKVYFESYPGFFATGNLYRPKGKAGPFPAILSPHGHWPYGRLEHSEACSVPGRAINFARQGYVVLTYDMVGYNDSRQVSHKFRREREELWGINLLGLQLWNSIRAVDFLLSLPDVDKDRIACTGASGGGTQTFLLTAVDDRVRVAAPVNMISAQMQGGDLCENAPNLRVDTFNVEIGALMAPRPLLLVSATGDWTKNTLETEYPAIRSIYRLLGAEDKVHSVRFNANHNYNKQSREAVYAWFGRWLLGLTDESLLKEKTFSAPLPPEQLVFYGTELPSQVASEQPLVSYLIGQAKEKIDALQPHTREKVDRFREVFGTSFEHSVMASLPGPSQVVSATRGKGPSKRFTTEALLIGRRDKGDRIPAWLWIPSGRNRNRKRTAILLIHPEGKGALTEYGNPNSPSLLVTKLLQRGDIVLGIDCFQTGEAKVNRASEKIDFFDTYNLGDDQNRVQDILTAVDYLRGRADVRAVNVIGLRRGGLWCMLARGRAGEAIQKLVVDADEFDSESDAAFLKDMLIPVIRRAGDFRTAGALAAPARLFVHHTGDRFRAAGWVSDVYAGLGAFDNFRMKNAKATEAEIISWLAE